MENENLQQINKWNNPSKLNQLFYIKRKKKKKEMYSSHFIPSPSP